MRAYALVLCLCAMVGVSLAKGPYKVVGNKVVDADGKDHMFMGVDRCSLEWMPTGDHISAQDFRLMASWGSNTVRVPLNQDYWLKGAANYSANYNQTVYQAVQWAHQAGLTVILDLHWSDKGDLSNIHEGQQRMADKNSVTFWQEVAQMYKNDPEVLFELYNEPHDVSWDVWLNGGDSGDGFTVSGMQELYNTVRATGANNLVVVGGLNWAFDLSGVATHRVKGTGIIYNTHPYNYGGKQPSDWDAAFGYLSATDPVMATEFGDNDCSPSYYTSFVAYAKAKGIMWTAWAWYPGGCTFPALINDWSGTPTVSGAIVKAALQAL
eukprot:TRINITY_DN147_c0_g1_i2.p1 TRINITY_DN147_c0_g1~~TRINITY_DN147_c0_g1_i2.p1  ORF type:complete len:323 (+),score=63.48 TRINITY_DN147_c0_g1_i2:162-1130(+)